MTVGVDLARQVRAAYDLPHPATPESLLGLFRQLHVPYLFVPIQEPGYYCSGSEPFALFQTDAPACVIAHEAFHLLTGSLDGEAVLYQYRAQETEAEEFARELCEEP